MGKLEPLKIFEMANVIQDETGLPMMIYISPKNANHGPRIKIQKNYSTKITNIFFSITIEDSPKIKGNIGIIKESDIELVKQWILLNKQLLLDYWDQKEPSTKKVLNNLKSIK